MNGTTQPRIFGLRIGLDPKFIVVGLIAVAALLFWYNSRSDVETPSRPAAGGGSSETSAGGVTATRAPGNALTGRGTTPAAARRAQRTNDHSTLRMRAIDATHGDIDPTLRLDLLARLQSLQEGGNSRNLFEMGAAPAPGMTDDQGRPIKHPIIPPKPIPQPPVIPGSANDPMADVNIPLKYYGFSKPVGKPQSNRGFFLDGDNILVASEGELVKQRYLVVELTATSARLEDTQVKKGKTLPIVPENKEASVAQSSPDE
ncbi:MAG: hypothetical protein JOY62_09425 [Acidobacteriaceae bacterium]|nr:hypothetical protein [Acidobacteriaceae bacterium]MBV9780180.1 hypothetical protein [Acidobacteriaceae bacterium]